MAAKLEKNRVLEERTLSRAILKKEKEKVAAHKKSAAQKKLIGLKKRKINHVKCPEVRNDEVRNSGFPQVLSKKARTFVTPFASQDLTNLSNLAS